MEEPRPVPTTGYTTENTAVAESGARASLAVLVSSGVVLLVLTCGVVIVFNRRIYLTGLTEPLWACSQVGAIVGENVLILGEREAKAIRLEGITPLKLGPIVQERDVTRAWRRALVGMDERSDDARVVIDDFDEGLDDAAAMDRKLVLLDELVSDPTRTVILLCSVSIRRLTDSLRHSSRSIRVAGGRRASVAISTDSGVTTLERWTRVLKAFVVIDQRQQRAVCPVDPVQASVATSDHATEPFPVLPEKPRREQSWSGRLDVLRKGAVIALLQSEGASHPYVRRVCEDLMGSDAVMNGRMIRRQVFDELAERTAHFYRGLWASCSEDEKVVLGHVAQHGLANASVRGVVRRLLGRRMLFKDPALRPMNETFRRFILTRECSEQVAALETASGPSAWDRLRAPLALAVVGGAIFLFATQKELYNAILGVTTAAAVSVPTLIRAVGALVGRPADGQGSRA